MKNKEKKMKKIFAILAILAFFMVPAASMAMVQTTDADLASITAAGVELDITPLTITMMMSSFTWGDYNNTGAFDAAISSSNFAGANYIYAGFVNVEFYPFPMHIFAGGAPAGGGSVMSTLQVTALENWQTSPTSAVDPFPGKSSLAQMAEAVTAGGTNLTDLIVDINIGTQQIDHGANSSVAPATLGKTAVQLAFVNGVGVTLDAIVGDIVLDNINGAVLDYAFTNKNSPSGMLATAEYNQSGLLGGIYAPGLGAQTLAAAQAGVVPTYASNTLGLFGISGINMTILPFSVTISAH
jgi:hypothetical protein